MSGPPNGYTPPQARHPERRTQLPEEVREQARAKLLGWLDSPDIACILGLIDEKGQPT